MKLVNIASTFILGYTVVTALTFNGQDNLNQAEMIATSYSDKVVEVVEKLKTENAELKNNIASLKESASEHITVDEYNELLTQLEDLQEEYNILLEEYDALVIANGEHALGNEAHQAEVNKANKELEKANKATEDHLKTIEFILDTQTLDDLLNN